MNEGLFLELYLQGAGIIESIPTLVPHEGKQVGAQAVVIAHNNQFYSATVSSLDTPPEQEPFVKSLKEVTPVEHRIVNYEPVHTLKGTREELIDKLYEALYPEVEFFYKDITEPYNGSVKKYDELTKEDIKDVAIEVINDLLSD